jgi:hypothetical protein
LIVKGIFSASALEIRTIPCCSPGTAQGNLSGALLHFPDARPLCMPQGFERYDRYVAHEKASKALELRILQHAFPENHLVAVPFLWNEDYLADKQVTLRIDRKGNLVRPVIRHLTPRRDFAL